MKWNRMDEAVLHNLYRKIEGFELGQCSLPQLSDLLEGYLSLHAMVRVMPWLQAGYGDPGNIAGKIEKLAGHMYERIVPGTSGDLYAGYLADIMDAAHECGDESLLQRTLDRSYDLLYRGGVLLRVEDNAYRTVRLLCDCYYHVQEDECAEAAYRVVAGWNERPGCAWESDVSMVESIQRLYVTDLFDAVTCGEGFSVSVKEGVSFSAARLSGAAGTRGPEEKTILEAGPSVRRLLALSSYVGYRSLYERMADLFGAAVALSRQNAGMEIICFSVLLPCFFAEQDYRLMQEQYESFRTEAE